LNALGYFPPARALVVKGTSRIHTNVGGGLLGAKGGGNVFNDNKKDNGDRLVIRPRREREREKLNSADKGDEKLLASNQGNANQGKQDGEKKKAAAETPGMLALKDDPTKAWHEALAKGVNDPGLIIACADYMAENKQFGHLALFLQENLRQGIVVRPWVYEALAMALEQAGGSPDEIERARLSAVDLEPQDAHGYLAASKAMAKLKSYDRAVAFCRQASLLEPNAPGAYEEGLLMADLAKDTQAMEWAAGGLLRRDWPAANDELHQKAKAKLQDLSKSLLSENRVAEAQRLANSVEPYSQRDMVIHLTWQGDADLDLEVDEPIKSKCFFMQRQTPGGGILLGDTMDDMTRESYILAKGFSGAYGITIRKIWGRPLGGKATVEIIQHQGTPRETRRRETVSFDRSYTMSVTLDEGRRTSAAYVPPPTATEKHTKLEIASSDQVLTKIRSLANPEITGGDSHVRGGLASLGLTVPSAERPKARATAGELVYQTKLQPGAGTGMDLTAQATIGPDQGVTLKLTPVFQSVTKGQPAVSNPLIPGGSEASGGD
jgi:tetratricopeptide (TPR) repeat protein